MHVHHCSDSYRGGIVSVSRASKPLATGCRADIRVETLMVVTRLSDDPCMTLTQARVAVAEYRL